ncbi:MAG: hypothetical protein IPL61_36370 [Myxococcales bacterium]|nr:hypothetical protein [Myxococcales bacterium]
MGDLALELAQLSTEYPIALLPVRLETRFVASPPSLKIRIYPDEIVADGHRRQLTTDEWTDAVQYWTDGWAPAAEYGAWQALTSRYPAERAAWLVERATPTNLAARPAEAPVFPAPDLKDDLLPEVTAAALPRSWLVIAYRGGVEQHRVTSADVAEPVHLSFAPTVAAGDPTLVTRDGLTIERELLWTIDYDEAVAIGMAVTMPLTSADLTAGFDRVIVVGVRTQTSAADGATLVTDLLDAHRYTRGVALVPQGTPTNNTAAAPAGYPTPGDTEARFALERAKASITPGTDGVAVAAALGVPATALARVAGQDRTEQAGAAAMNLALWPCTLGYFLGQLMAPHVTDEQIAAARTHFHEFVRGRGPLPVVRVGRVPYGLLPVTSSARWQAAAHPIETGLATLLKGWRTQFLARAATVPRVGATADPDEDLLGVLTRDARSREVRTREVYGPAFVANLFLLLGVDGSGAAAARLTLIAQALAEAGLTGLSPRVAELTLGDRALRIGRNWVVDGAVSETAALAPNYIDWVRTAELIDLRRAGAPSNPAFDNPLLFHLLRQATLVESARVGVDVAVGAGLADAVERVERELHRIGPGTEARPTSWERLDAPVSGVTGGQTLAAWLGDPLSTGEIRQTLREHRAALATLATVPTAELSRLFIETLDVCSHRVDAWLTSLATRRLATMRGAHATGVYVGAYGWVEELRPRTAPRPGTAGGFIHAPSAAHATTAAVLRNAHLTRVGAQRDLAAVDLSSRRVRGALELLDAVRQGVPLAAVLGFRVERGLHDAQLDRYIAPLRAAFPLGNDPALPVTGGERIAARNVVDGLALRTALGGQTTEATIPWASLPPVDVADRKDLTPVLAALEHDVDAVADLLLAETVHQTVQGKTERAAGTLAALAGGGAVPEPEVVSTPRRGASVTHRAAIVLGAPGSDPAMATWTATVRTAAEPRLASWAALRLGDASAVQARVTYPAPTEADPAARGSAVVTLAQLGIGPLDALAMARRTGADGSGELDRRLRGHAATALGQVDGVEIEHARVGGEVTFLELVEVASSLNQVLDQARPLAPADVAAAGDKVGDIDFAELASRADAATGALTAARTSLADALAAAAADDAPSSAALRSALWPAAAFGVAEALPRQLDDGIASERAALRDAAVAALATIDRRLAEAAAAAIGDARLRALFGGTLVVLPTFAPVNQPELEQAVAYGPTLVPDPVGVRRWFVGAAAVRPRLAAWRLATLASEALSAARTALVPAQVPHRVGAPWAGGTFDLASTARPRPGTVSLVMDRQLAFGPTIPWAGLLVDEWSEVIPSEVQETSIALHHDAPGAEAAQCVLLAVPPNPKGAWDLPSLEAIVNETLELAKIRAVDNEALGPLGLLAPTTFLAANLADDTMTADLAALTIGEATVLAAE